MITVQISNSQAKYRNNDSGYRGITRHNTGKWEAFISILQKSGYKKIYIGLYPTIEEAVEARKNFIISLL